ncbi:MAG: ferritin [bacterium]|jgi:ferritin
MISDKMQKALNDQLREEYFSSYLYLSMAAYFHSRNLDGFANWMMKQSDEEKGHAMKFYEYINEQQGKVVLGALEKPQTDWASPLAAFQDAYKHEQKITGLIHSLTDMAMAEKDHATHIFLHWFVEEQVEEESNVSKVVEMLKMVNDHPQGLLMLDRALGERK